MAAEDIAGSNEQQVGQRRMKILARDQHRAEGDRVYILRRAVRLEIKYAPR